MTGYLDDGTLGLLILKSLSGLVVIQDPETAYCPEMPRNAMVGVKADYVLSPYEIGPLL